MKNNRRKFCIIRLFFGKFLWYAPQLCQLFRLQDSTKTASRGAKMRASGGFPGHRVLTRSPQANSSSKQYERELLPSPFLAVCAVVPKLLLEASRFIFYSFCVQQAKRPHHARRSRLIATRTMGGPRPQALTGLLLAAGLGCRKGVCVRRERSTTVCTRRRKLRHTTRSANKRCIGKQQHVNEKVKI